MAENYSALLESLRPSYWVAIMDVVAAAGIDVRVAVLVVNHLGDAVMKVFKVS